MNTPACQEAREMFVEYVAQLLGRADRDRRAASCNAQLTTKVRAHES